MARLFRLTHGAGLALTLLTASCGGRASHPVAATMPYDNQLDCAHLQAERSVNSARMADLLGEQNNHVRDNLGMLLVNPLFLNLSGAEQKEITAFQERNEVLDRLMVTRCATPSNVNP